MAAQSEKVPVPGPTTGPTAVVSDKAPAQSPTLWPSRAAAALRSYQPWALAAFAVAVIWRQPLFFTQPRFWAEEYNVYFAWAHENSFFLSLFRTPIGHQGYWLLCTSVPTALATLVPLEWAPAVTTCFSFGFVVLVAAVILWGRSYVFHGPLLRLAGSCALLVVSALSDEVWLNSTNLQVYCGMAGVCLLLEDLRLAGRARRWAYRALLGFSALSGLYVIALGPAFLLKAWRERSREAWVHFFVLCGALLAHAALFATLNLTDNFSLDNRRLEVVSPFKKPAQVLYYHVVEPVMGKERGPRVIEALGLEHTAVAYEGRTQQGPAVVLAGWLCGGLLLLLLYLLARNDWRGPVAWMAVAFCGLAFFVAMGAQDGVPRNRYVPAPAFAFVLLLLANARLVLEPALRPWRRVVAAASVAAVALALWHGARDYTQIDGTFDYSASAPVWKDEVARWRADASTPLTVFPYPRWSFPLPREEDGR